MWFIGLRTDGFIRKWVIRMTQCRDLLYADMTRYTKKAAMPKFQKLYRKVQGSQGVKWYFWKLLYKLAAQKSHIEISTVTKIGGTLYRASILYYH